MYHTSIIRRKISGRTILIIIGVIFIFLGNGGSKLGIDGANIPNVLAASNATSSLLAYDVDIPILAYHKVDTSAPTTWYVTIDQFTRQMEVLQAYGYQAVSLEDFLDYRDGAATPPERPVIITFDDGYQGFYEYAYPILAARDMQATVFVLTGYTGETEDERYDNSWNPTEPLTYHMIWPEIVALDSAGFSIGSHTITHPNLLDLTPDEADYEISYSYQDIQAHIGSSDGMSFAYPYGNGAYSQTIQTLVQQAGYSSAVSFDGDDGIANPAESDIWALPRRSIFKEVTLELDNSDPWYFFMRRVDPDFPLPNISLDGFSILDSAGDERSRFYPGETLTITLDAFNWGSPTDVRATLQVTGTSSTIYNSHWISPTEDVVVQPFSYSSDPTEFTYRVSLSETAIVGDYSYSFNIFDIYYLLDYYRNENQPAFAIEESPISVKTNVEVLELQGNDMFDLWFTVENTRGSADDMYLTVSLSHGLKVISTYPEENWVYYPIGSEVKMRDCAEDCPLSSYKIYEAYEAEYGTGKRSYRLTVQSLTGSTENEWIKYRLTMRLPEGQLTPDWYLRNPLSGELDQQGWSVWSLPAVVDRNDLFIPLLLKQ